MGDLVKHVSDSFKMVRDITAERRVDRRYELLASYYENACRRKDEGEALTWVNFATIPELFWAMDLVPLYIDAVVGPATGFSEKGLSEYIDTAEEIIPDHLCATNKSFVGAILQGDVPIPGMLINAGHPCDSNIATYPVIAEKYGIPYFCVDAPYWRDERGMKHMTEELERLVTFLEDITGHSLDVSKLRQTMEYSNRAHEFILKINRLKMASPAPCPGVDSASDYLLGLCLPGTPQFADYCEERYEFLKGKVDQGEGAVPDERLRLAWIFGAPSFDVTIFPWLEKEYGAASILLPGSVLVKPVEEISSRQSIMEGLAEKMVTLPMGKECGGPWENYVDTAIEFCAEFKADAAIFLNNLGCQHNWPITKLVKDKIYDQLGIPTLIAEADFFDSRVVSGGEIKTKVEEFLSTVVER